MIIKQLTLHNFGVYAGTNTFEFFQKKPIVLIGGMNGRGKTTFLEAILIALYGSNSIAYKESKFQSYNQYLRSFVNWEDWSQSCYVELAFVLNENSHDVYLIRRSWNALSKITKESINVWQNGVESDFLTKNWSMFVENILPSALSGFFFFDGEKIAELAVDDSNKQIKESIRAMLGLTVLDVLKNDLGRSIRRTSRRTSNSKAGNFLEQIRQERDSAREKLQEIEKKIGELELKIAEVNTKIETLHNEYEINGGAVVKQRQKLIQERAVLQNSIQQNQETLAGIAATELPLFLVKDLVEQIKKDAEKEHNDLIMKQALEKMGIYLDAFEDEKQGVADESRRFIEFVKKINHIDDAEPVYRLSEQALFQLHDLSDNLDNQVNNVKEKIQQKIQLKKQMDEVESYLSLDINENELSKIYEKIKEQEAVFVQLQVELSKLQQERSCINSIVIAKTAEYNKKVEAYLQDVEMYDDAERTLKYSHMAISLIDAYTVELQKKKTGNLGKTITGCYKKLANKKNLIHEIVMNPETLDMEYLDESGKSVAKNSLSAGEKQLMVIAILWALAICSKKKLPVIIDTPLSRLDSQHRAAIITTYFPNASDQIIILSTDTEIDHKYYDMMKESVGDEFTLVYNEETKSTSIKKGYFQKI